MRFLLVDRILAIESGKSAEGIKNVTLSEEFLADHFPESPVLPGVLILESLVQLADWVIREHSDFQLMGLPADFTRIRFRRFVRPGDQLHLAVSLTSSITDTVSVHGKATCRDQVMTSGTFTLSVHPIDMLHSAEEARNLYKLIYFQEDE